MVEFYCLYGMILCTNKYTAIISKITVYEVMSSAMGTNKPTTIGSIVVDDAGGVVGLPRTAYDGCLLQKSGHGLSRKRFVG